MFGASLSSSPHFINGRGRKRERERDREIVTDWAH